MWVKTDELVYCNHRFKVPELGKLSKMRATEDSSERQIFAMDLKINLKYENQAFASIITTIIPNASLERQYSVETVALTGAQRKFSPIILRDDLLD